MQPRPTWRAVIGRPVKVIGEPSRSAHRGDLAGDVPQDRERRCVVERSELFKDYYDM
jgi:hypothetical protein